MKYDVTDVESSNFESPQPGTYRTKVFSVVDRTAMEGKNDWEVVLEVQNEGRFKGARLWFYLVWGESSAWKRREFIEALGMKLKGVLDSDRLVDKEVGAVVVADSYNGEYKGRIAKFIPISALDDDADDDEDEVDEDEVDAEDDDEGDEEEQDYSSMTANELRKLVDERELHLSAKDRKDKDAMIAALEEDDEEDADDEEDEEEPEPTPKAKAGKQKVGGKKAAAVVAADDNDGDMADDEEEDDDGEDEASDEEDEDYTEWTVADLKEELESRGLSTKGSTKTLISRLEKDDASAADPF